MGTQRNGARSFLNLLAKARKMRAMPGFVTGLEEILGVTDASALVVAWNAVDALITLLVGTDDWYNQLDYTSPSRTGSEDQPPS